MEGSLFIMGDSSLLRFFTLMDGISSLWEIVYCSDVFLLLMEVSSLYGIVRYRGFTLMDGSLFIMGDSLLLMFYSDG